MKDVRRRVPCRRRCGEGKESKKIDFYACFSSSQRLLIGDAGLPHHLNSKKVNLKAPVSMALLFYISQDV